MSILILIGSHAGIAGGMAIVACVILLLLTVKKEVTWLDHLLVRLMMIGVIALIAGAGIYVTGVITKW
jgi:hypothetical protein